MACKHWIATVDAQHPTAKFWENEVTREHLQYLVGQEEVGKGGFDHYQLYVVLKEKKRVSWLKKHVHPTAHWEKKRGTVAEAIDYVTKEDTRKPNGIKIEIGEKPKEQSDSATEARMDKIEAAKRLREKDDIRQQAQEILTRLEDEFIPITEIPADVLMYQGFLTTYKAKTKDIVGPMRHNLKIVTLIGPPGCGKSYSIAKLFPKAGRVMYGNNGTWFANARSRTMVFEEFMGQIPLQNMLKYLDPYPMNLEVKGGVEPAFYDLVIITSNTDPKDWYTTADEFKDKPGDPTAATTAKRRRTDALAALWDRIGYKPLSRDSGDIRIYTIDENIGVPMIDQIAQIREEIMEYLKLVKFNQELNPMPNFNDEWNKHEEEEMPSAQDPDQVLSPISALQSDNDTEQQSPPEAAKAACTNVPNDIIDMIEHEELSDH